MNHKTHSSALQCLFFVATAILLFGCDGKEGSDFHISDFVGTFESRIDIPLSDDTSFSQLSEITLRVDGTYRSDASLSISLPSVTGISLDGFESGRYELDETEGSLTFFASETSYYPLDNKTEEAISSRPYLAEFIDDLQKDRKPQMMTITDSGPDGFSGSVLVEDEDEGSSRFRVSFRRKQQS